VCIVTASGFLLDVITGSTLQISSLFGYSPVVAGRFYGIGNLAFVIMGTTALLGLGVLLRPDGWKAGGIAVSVGVVVLLVDGHPSLGADLGGTLAIAPAFGATALMMAGRKVRWRTMILLCVAAAAAAFGIAYLDSLRDVSVQTHLGRFASTLIEGGMDAVRPIIMRKLEANVSVLTGSVLSLGVPIAGGFLFIWMRKRRDRLQSLFAHEPGLRPAFVGMIVLNVVGFAVNDSGVPILAMGLALAVPFLLATVLSQDPGSKIGPGRV
jgi:hypothetical protein